MPALAFVAPVRPVRLDLDAGAATPAIAAHIAELAPAWPRATPSATVDAVLRADEGGYTLEPLSYAAAPFHFPAPLAAANGAVGGLIAAYVAQSDQLCVLHAAAWRGGTGVVVMLGAHNAGKSTLTMALAQAGAPLLGDDRIVVAQTPAGFAALAQGIAPKLRRPLPAEAPPAFTAFVDRYAGAAEGEMQLLHPPFAAPFGTNMPIAHMVLLGRTGSAPTLAPARPAEVVKALVELGFAPQLEAAGRLRRWTALAALPCWRLDYDSAFAAAPLLLERFG